MIRQMRVVVHRDGDEFPVPVNGISEVQHEKARKYLAARLPFVDVEKRKYLVAEYFGMLLDSCPEANPADLWCHVIYRNYCSILNLDFANESWVTVSGKAFELWLVAEYKDRFARHGLRMRQMSGIKEKDELLVRAGLRLSCKPGDVDVVLEREGVHGFMPSAFLHLKTSVAERLKEDVPASRAMMLAGIKSCFCTLDAFAPACSKFVVTGGFFGKDTKNRDTFEKDKSFNAGFSWNERTVPSADDVIGSRIYVVDRRADLFVDWFVKHAV